MEPRIGAYIGQRSNGDPLNDPANIKALVKYDDITFDITPWAKDINGSFSPSRIYELKKQNPRLRPWLYVLAGDQWLPPSFTPGINDKSGFADIFNAVKNTDGFLYDTTGALWLENYRVNLGKLETVQAMTNEYIKFLKLACSTCGTSLFYGIFLDCCHTSITWTDNSTPRELDVTRAGFTTLTAMDNSRLTLIKGMVKSLQSIGMVVAINGTGPMAGQDIDFKEGLGSLITIDQATAWVKSPGRKWLMAEAYSPAEASYKTSMLRNIASSALSEMIISCGPGRKWPPIYP